MTIEQQQDIDKTPHYDLIVENEDEEKIMGCVCGGIIDDDKECTSILSVISNEEASIISEIIDMKSFCPRKNSDGEDINGHIGHIDSPETEDTYPNSDQLQGGESLLDDIRSMLGTDLCGYDQDSVDNTYTDDTTLFHSDLCDSKNEKPSTTTTTRKKSIKRDSFDNSFKKRRNSTKLDEDTTQFGFENRAFMSQHVYLDNRYDDKEPIRYCSLAQFVEGNDIARRSFKRTKSTKLSKTETNVNRQSTLTEESEISSKGSKTSLNKIEKELSNLKETVGLIIDVDEEDDLKLQFPQVSVIVEPPSPDINENVRTARMENLNELDTDLIDFQLKTEHLSTSDVTTSNNSSNSNLLVIDQDPQFLTTSPGRTRRISCCSMLNPNEAAALAAAAATSKFYEELDKSSEKKDDKEPNKTRKLPIINPLVRLPTWPSKLCQNGRRNYLESSIN